jgi:hypothetical protein
MELTSDQDSGYIHKKFCKSRECTKSIYKTSNETIDILLSAQRIGIGNCNKWLTVLGCLE